MLRSRSMRWPVLTLVFAACGGSSTSTSRPEPPAEAPRLLGNAVWDGPLNDPMAQKLLARVNASLADPPPTLQGTDSSAWVEPVKGWIDRRARVGREIRRDADALVTSGDPRLQLLAAIALGVAGDDLVTDMLAIQLPVEVRDGELGADIERAFRQTIEDNAIPVAVVAREALQTCTELAPQSPTLSAWAVFCRKRADSLAELEKRVAERVRATPAPIASKPAAKPPAMFSDCDTKEVLHVPPDALPPDRKKKPVVAFIYTSDDLKGDDALALETAVAAKLRGEVKLPVVDAKELAAARALVAQRKLHAKGPVCGQAPPLPAVVQHKRKHVIVGEITTTCMYTDIKKSECGLLVQYSRAGDEDHEGLPKPMFAPVASRDVPASEWIAAAGKLAESEGAGGLLGTLRGGAAEQLFFDFSGYRDDDPWLRVADTLNSETIAKVASCVDAPASFDATLTIGRDGKTSSVALTPVTAPAAGSKVGDCVKQALEATPWPCTRDGKPGKVAVRVCVAPRRP